MVPEWLIIDFIPKIEILFQNLALEITFSEFFQTVIFLGTEAITRIDFWIFFPKFMILNKNKNWKKWDTTQNFPKISLNQNPKSENLKTKIWKFVLPSSVEVLLYYLRTISSCFSALSA